MFFKVFKCYGGRSKPRQYPSESPKQVFKHLQYMSFRPPKNGSQVSFDLAASQHGHLFFGGSPSFSALLDSFGGFCFGQEATSHQGRGKQPTRCSAKPLAFKRNFFRGSGIPFAAWRQQRVTGGGFGDF